MTNRPSKVDENLVKVLFELAPGEWHGSGSETLWAEQLDERLYRLRNTPFFAFGVSFLDVVVARPEGSLYAFERVEKHSGHSTYRVITFAAASAEFESAWQRILDLGCTWEGGPGRLRALDVPPETDVYKVYALLEDGEQRGLWDFEEGHCGHPVAG